MSLYKYFDIIYPDIKLDVSNNALFQGLELTTPVLEKAPAPWEKSQPLLPVSQVWMLAATLPPLFTKPTHHSPTSSTAGNGFCMQNYLAKIVSANIAVNHRHFLFYL